MKLKTVYVCQECGYTTPKWMGQCPGCNAWNTFIEEVVARESQPAGKSHRRFDSTSKPVKISNIKDSDVFRIKTGFSELDRALGGGLVAGSLVLVGGYPGVGKSTLLMEIARNVSSERTVLYVSGEESLS